MWPLSLKDKNPAVLFNVKGTAKSNKVVRTHLRVKGRKESPVHCKNFRSVFQGSSRQIFGIANVQIWVGTGQSAKSFKHGIRIVEMNVNSHDPVWIINLNELQIFGNALEVSSLNANGRTRVSIKWKSDNFLAASALECVRAASRFVDWNRVGLFEYFDSSEVQMLCLSFKYDSYANMQ